MSAVCNYVYLRCGLYCYCFVLNDGLYCTQLKWYMYIQYSIHEKEKVNFILYIPYIYAIL